MEKVKLGDLCSPSAGQIKEDADELIDYIDISSVDNETKKVTGYQTVLFGEAPSRARKAVKKGNILVSTVRPNLNAVAMLEDDTPNISVASTGFCVLECKENVDKRFVFNYCKSKAFIDDMVSQATGASYPAVSDKIVRSATLPNYSYEEQCEIGKVLDKVALIIESRKGELASLDNLIKSRFVELFGDPVSNPKGWQLKPLMEMGYCKNGMNFHAGDSGIVMHCLGVGDFKDYSIIDGTEHLPTVSLNEEPPEESMLQDGDIVFVRSNGNKALVGRCVVVYPHDTPTTYSGFCIRYRLTGKEVITSYLLRVLKADSMRKKMAGRGANIQNLNQQILASLDIPLPPIELQQQFAAFVAQVDKSKLAVQKSLDETQQLFDSLMQQYFG